MSREEREILFDFDAEWTEESGQLPPGGRSRRRPPAIPFRLAVLVASIIVLTVVISALANGCGVASQTAQTRSYLQGLAAVAAHSQQLGARFSALVVKRSGSPSALRSSLAQLSQQAEQDALAAGRLHPPPALLSEQASALQALELRVSGLQGFAAASASAGAATTGQPMLLLALTERLLASDVIWRDLVEGAARATLTRAGIRGIGVPASTFLTAPDLASTAAMARLWRALSGHPLPERKRTLKVGDRGAAVARWQELLVRWLEQSAPTKPRPKPDGVFGPTTDSLTRAFQTAQGLPPDGIVGSRTLGAMTALLRKRTKPATG